MMLYHKEGVYIVVVDHCMYSLKNVE